MKLVIGNKNYSSWSLRPWLLMTAHGLKFDEISISLKQEFAARALADRKLGQYSPTYKVPVLIDDELTVWDSLAICEYISERYLDNRGWPKEVALRAQARAVCAEMHAGFNALRNELPMNCRASRQLEFSDDVQKDIARIDQLWSADYQKTGKQSGWLFGDFSIADCFYAPVALRFNTYQVELSQASAQYQARLLAHGAVKSWIESALQESEILQVCEVGQ